MNQYDFCILTFSGVYFDPLKPNPDNINIEDIAHSLSMQCRFAGHCNEFYSIAEHSCHVHDLVSGENKMWGLLHDASEAYLVDIPTPLKPHITNYKSIERDVTDAIYNKFGLKEPAPEEIKIIDRILFYCEAVQDMNNVPEEWVEKSKALDIKLKFWDPKTAKKEFLRRYEKGCRK